MEIKKTAQQILFTELKKSELKAKQKPQYNGFSIDKFGYFKDKLNKSFENFIAELNDNLTNRSASLPVYLKDILKTTENILIAFNLVHKDEIYETQKHNPEQFRQNRLGYINHFFNFQKEIIYKTIAEIEQKLSIVSDPEVFMPTANTSSANPDSSDSSPLPQFSFKLKSNLSRKDLTVLWWLLSECDFIEFKTQKHLADFLEQNFLYKEPDDNGVYYEEMKSIQSLLSRLKENTTVKPTSSQVMIASRLHDRFEELREEIIDLLEKHKLPTVN